MEIHLVLLGLNHLTQILNPEFFPTDGCRMPVWVTDLAYLPGDDQRKIAVCTAYGQVRLYDIRAQRRPVVDARVTEVETQNRRPFKTQCLQPFFDALHVMLSNQKLLMVRLRVEVLKPGIADGSIEG